MRNALTFIIGLLLLLTNTTSQQIQAQNGIEWSEPINITFDGFQSGTIGVLGDGTPVVLWGKGSKILFSRMIDGTFETPIEINTDGNSPDIYGFGGLDMAVKDNQIHIVFENFFDGVFHIRSTDGGATFEPPVNVYDPPQGKWTTLASIELDDDNNPLISVIFENTNETEGTYILMRSLDGGETFNPPVTASEPANGEYVCECCPSDIVTQDENVWLVFRNNDNNLRDMWVSKSTDGGDTFETAVDIDSTDWVLNACPISGPKMTTMGGDSLISVWMSGASGSGRVSYSTFNGATMEKGFETQIPQTNEGANQQNAAVAGVNDTIGIVWEENGFETTGRDILFAYSYNGTEGLLDTIYNITEATGSQSFPAIAYANGIFHLINTQSSGLEYRSATLEMPDIVEPPDTMMDTMIVSSYLTPDFLELQLIEQPIRQDIVKLNCLSNSESDLIGATLYDLSGNKMQHWSNLPIKNNGELWLNTHQVATGLYLLSIETKRGIWSTKLLKN